MATETDMARRLRDKAEEIRHGIQQLNGSEIRCLLFQAAKEVDRYYNGMMNWKRTAEAKDAEFVKSRVDKEANT